MINSLQSLRGIFAIMIFLSHFVIGAGDERAFYPGGTMGVEYFIMLSGFVMCAGYEKIIQTDGIAYKDFMLRRLIRVYPLHLLCLILWLIVYNAATTIPAVGANILLVQSWIPYGPIYYGCNTPSWCLSVFLFLYAVFPALITFITRRPAIARRCLTWAILIFVIYIIILPSGRGETWTSRICPPVRLIDFSIGIALWQLYSRGKNHPLIIRLKTSSLTAKTIVELIPVALYTVCSLLADRLPIKWCSEIVWWAPTVLAIMIFSVNDNNGGLISRLLYWRPLVAFGNVSFCFYLLHIIVIGATYRFMYHFDIVPDNVYVMLFITLTIGIISSFAVNRWFDRPVGRFLRSKLR